MADCPKCKKHLKLTDWKPNCPYCGANIVVYDLQERLMTEADSAEVQYYYFQQKVDRLKASFVGSKIAVVRIFTSLLPIVAIFLPLVKINLSAPFEPYSGNLGALELYNMFDKIKPDVFIEVISNADTKTAGILFTASLLCLLLSVVAMLVHFLLNMLSCSPKGRIIGFTGDIVFLGLAAAAALSFVLIPENPFVSGSLGIGAYLYIALVTVNFIVDILFYKNMPEVKHAQCYVGGIPIEEYFEMVEKGVPREELRQEMYRRLTAIQEEQERKLQEKLQEGGEVNE